MEPYKGILTRSKNRNLLLHEIGQSYKSETRNTLIIGDREEINEIPDD